eukprot:7017154-Prymnesium_polylepis.2
MSGSHRAKRAPESVRASAHNPKLLPEGVWPHRPAASRLARRHQLPHRQRSDRDERRALPLANARVEHEREHAAGVHEGQPIAMLPNAAGLLVLQEPRGRVMLAQAGQARPVNMVAQPIALAGPDGAETPAKRRNPPPRVSCADCGVCGVATCCAPSANENTPKADTDDKTR